MEVKKLETLIKKQNKGTLSTEERELLEGFIKNQYEHSDSNNTPNQYPPSISENIWKSIHTKISPKPVIRKLQILKYSAIACGISIIIIFSLLNSNVKYNKSFATNNAIDTLYLADGTKVILAAHTSIKYPSEFNSKTRNVELIEGNAFFKVKHNDTIPFIVHSNNIQTKVLGTSFNIKTSDQQTEVCVATGKVRVSNGEQAYNLLPNQKIISQKGNLTFSKTKNSDFKKWFKRNYDFQQSPLLDITHFLSYKYNIQFEFNDELLARQKLTLHISTEDCLDKILDNLTFLTQLKFKQHEKTILVSKN